MWATASGTQLDYLIIQFWEYDSVNIYKILENFYARKKVFSIFCCYSYCEEAQSNVMTVKVIAGKSDFQVATMI